MLHGSKISAPGLRHGRTRLGIHAASIALGLLVVDVSSSLAAPQSAFDNSLWIGTDNTTSRNVLNMDRSGALLRSVGPVDCTGFAIDLSAQVIYFATSTGVITSRDLATAAAGSSFAAGGSEDMTFDGTSIWRTGAAGPASSNVITKIDPVGHGSTPGFTVPFQTVGIAWDGSGFWISSFGTDGIVERFDPAGVPTGESFHTSGGHINGGLAFDSTDSTLFVGTFGGVYHYSRTGTALGSFTLPADQSPGRFVDGLEFEPAPAPVGIGGTPAPVALILSISPNPSRGEVRFVVETARPARLGIYTLAGRLVRELQDAEHGSGRVAMSWDGRDAGGARMPSGLYFVQARAGANSEVRKFSLIR